MSSQLHRVFGWIPCMKCSSLRLTKSPNDKIDDVRTAFQWLYDHEWENPVRTPNIHKKRTSKETTKSGNRFTNIKQENRISFRAQNSIIDLLQSWDAELWNCVQFLLLMRVVYMKFIAVMIACMHDGIHTYDKATIFWANVVW